MAFGAAWLLIFWKVVRAAAGPDDGYPFEAILWLMPGLGGLALGAVLMLRKKSS